MDTIEVPIKFYYGIQYAGDTPTYHVRIVGTPASVAKIKAALRRRGVFAARDNEPLRQTASEFIRRHADELN